MPSTVRDRRVIHTAIVNGKRDHLNISLTDGQAGIRSARKYADVFHPYQFTDRTGTARYVVYARYLPGSPKHGFSSIDSTLDVIYLFEVTAQAVEAAFGLAPTT